MGLNKIIDEMVEEAFRLEIKEQNCKMELKEIAIFNEIYSHNYTEIVVSLFGTNSYDIALRLYYKACRYESKRLAILDLIRRFKEKRINLLTE